MLAKTIIIVDDDEDILNLFKHFLKESFNEIVTFNNALEAIEVMKFKKVDLVITDILMPKMNGIEFTKIIHEKFPGLPVLVCSEGGSTEAKDIVASIVMNKALFFGATYALKKPFNKNELIETMTSIIEGRVDELITQSKEDAS